jgi:hypothetical protein
MKQLCPSYSISGQAITLNGVNLPQDHILLISNATSGGVLYSLSSGTAASYSQGTNSVLTLIGSVDIADSDKLVIYYDDGIESQNSPSSVSVSNFPATQPVSGSVTVSGVATAANQTTGNSSLSTIASNTTPRNNSFAIPFYTSKEFVYTGANITTINYYTGGSTLVAHRTLAYSGSNITSDTLSIP